MKKNLIPNPLKIKCNKFKVSHNQPESNLFIIRHAESHFNKAIHDLENKKNYLDSSTYKKKKEEIRFGQDMCDCPITDNGKDQCHEAGNTLQNFDFKYVFVSPLRRTLMTLENVLEGVNRDRFKKINPEVIVHPMIFEKIEDSCDVLDDINKNMKDYSYYNWSLFSSIEHTKAYQLKYCDEKLQDQINYFELAINNYKKKNCYNHHDVVLSAMKELSVHDKYIESSKMTIKRLGEFLQFLKLFLENKKIEKNENILIVGHSILFKHLTCNLLDENDHLPDSNEIVLRNCEVANISLL